MRVIRGKKAMVTGAASGIGRAIALALADEGADLFLVDIKRDNLEAVAREARGRGVEAIAAACDLADPAQIGAVVDRLRRTWNRLNILVNNAGVLYYGQTHLMTGDQWKRIMSVNLLAPIQLVHELLPTLLAAEDAHIVNVSSMFGLTPARKLTAYQTSKYGLVGFSAALHAEYCDDSFGVTALCPGFVHSSLIDDMAADRPDRTKTVPSWICTTPEKVAVKAIRAIRKNQGLVLVTPAAHLYWRLTRLLPTFVAWVMREGWRRRRKRAPAVERTGMIDRQHIAERSDAATGAPSRSFERPT